MSNNSFCQLIPPAAECVLHIGPVEFEAAQCYGTRRIKVCRLGQYPSESPRLPSGAFDCAVIDLEVSPAMEGIPRLESLIDCLAPNGRISLILGGIRGDDDLIDKVDAAFLKAGLLRFKVVPLPSHAGENERLAIMGVKRGHNPVTQARDLAAFGRYENALQVLNEIPDELILTIENLSRLASEKQKILLEWQRSLPSSEPAHKLFFRARREFAQVTSTLPLHHPAYRHEADFWLHLGNPDMARRTLRSILHVAADEATRLHLDTIPAPGARPAIGDTAPEWGGTRRPPNILILTHDHSDYGMDTLYDGLCRVIGVENVVEYPWKPMLHGRCRDAAQNYPCVFDYDSDPVALEQLLQDLRDARFDLIVYADVVQMTRRDEVQRILEAGRDLPLVMYDPWDSCYTPMDIVASYIGGHPIELVFKREMLEGVDYGPNTVPLPFGFSGAIAVEPGIEQREVDLFWAGKRMWSLRPLCLKRIEQVLGRTFQDIYDQSEYSRRLSSARIGLSLFGSGFDSVRFWEIPAHGVMLLAERPPIRIPNNFINEESAVFFDDLPELEQKLNHYLARSDEAREIAAEGRRHFLKYHTASARARQFLGHLESRLSW